MHDVTPEQAARHEVNFLVWFSLSAIHTGKEWIRRGRRRSGSDHSADGRRHRLVESLGCPRPPGGPPLIMPAQVIGSEPSSGLHALSAAVADVWGGRFFVAGSGA